MPDFEPTPPEHPEDVPPLVMSAPPVDESGAWVPPTGPGVTPAGTPIDPTAPPARKTLAEWADEYDWRRNPHPYIHKFKAIPMGGDRVPMNHSIDVLNYMAIHAARLGAVFPDDKGNYPAAMPTGVPEIHYQEPLHGPPIVTNPGEWIDIDQSPKERAALGSGPQGTIDLSGVPEDALKALEAAVQAERNRKIMADGADPAARAEALSKLATEPAMGVVVSTEPIVMPEPPADGESVSSD